MNPDLVLPSDLEHAASLIECCMSCLNRAESEFAKDNLEDTERWVNEYHRCKRVLDNLIDKKKQREKMQLLANDLKAKGINIELIKKLTAANSERFN